MTPITQSDFDRLAAAGYNRVPLTLETYADLDTPLSLYLKLASGRNSFLLESVVGGERFGRYSFIGLPARTLLRANAWHTEVVCDGQVTETFDGNPLDFIAEYQSRLRAYVPADFPRFCGGLAGYFAYDAVRYMEHKLARFDKSDEIGMPDVLLLQTEELAVVDNLAGKIYLIVYADTAAPNAYATAHARLETLAKRLREPVTIPTSAPVAATPVIRDFAKADYLAAVQTAKDYIAAGDMMQVQVGQRLKKPFACSPLTLYRALRSINPSPYMYFYDFGEFQVVGASPEILVRQETAGQRADGKRITIRPLAGTRPRGATPEADRANAEELLADPKERAEHVMLIDLARNDIGRIAQTGSVHVTDQMVIERYSHVMHIVSNVEGMLLPGLNNLDVLKATFPAGTLTGAPKIHAMEIIDELEPVKRGLYGGACGYLSFSGEMDMAIAIRTGIVKDGMLYVQAAAGIVADSVPENEWQETENKARALMRAAELAEAGLDHVATA
uniref:Anthranilate synthase component 1 n=1 Tax=uncultured bacterium UPO35 TaxID=1776962 RepID=A0A126SXI5_9BACT|nr:anthranilate synthase component I [uncultured bacterium UPO35]